MSNQSDRTFSFGWVVISYFFLFGGLLLSGVLFGVTKVSGSWVPYAVCVLGGVIGGFFTGQASPHRSIIEPAIAGALMIATFWLAFFITPVGKWIFSVAEGDITKTGLIAGALSLVGGAVGAVLGELASGDRSPPRNAFAWIGYSTILTLGALLAFFFLVALAILRGEVTNSDQAAAAVLIAMAAAAFVGSMVAQTAAPRRVLIPSSLGFVVAGVLMILLAASKDAPSDAIMGFVIIVVVGFGIAVGGAAIGYVIVRGRIRAAEGVAQGVAPAGAPAGYPPQPGGYPPQQGGYSPQQGGGYPPQQGGGYPPQQGGGYPPQGGGYPPQGGGQPPQGGGQPLQG